MRSYFHQDEEKEISRLRLLQTEVAEQKLYPQPCPLLKSQLNEMEVMAKKMLESVHRMQAFAESEDWK